jgi:hypothetical protein
MKKAENKEKAVFFSTFLYFILRIQKNALPLHPLKPVG